MAIGATPAIKKAVRKTAGLRRVEIGIGGSRWFTDGNSHNW
jgi:hypothetical protein